MGALAPPDRLADGGGGAATGKNGRARVAVRARRDRGAAAAHLEQGALRLRGCWRKCFQLGDGPTGGGVGIGGRCGARLAGVCVLCREAGAPKVRAAGGASRPSSGRRARRMHKATPLRVGSWPTQQMTRKKGCTRAWHGGVHAGRCGRLLRTSGAGIKRGFALFGFFWLRGAKRILTWGTGSQIKLKRRKCQWNPATKPQGLWPNEICACARPSVVRARARLFL